MEPDALPAAVAETHISVVLFNGSRAYKWCKPVDLGFIDLSTPARREAALLRELELNRRFAPDVYLDVVGLVPHVAAEATSETEHRPTRQRRAEATSETEHRPEPLDHVLVMRRMPADRRLARLLAGPEAADELRAVARQVAVIHASAPRPAAAADAASPAALRANWEENEAAMLPFGGRFLDEDRLTAVGRAFRRYLDGRRPLLDARIAAGHAVDGHGDLLADDIFCLPDGVRILDCLAFDDHLRYGDVLADIAFLAMDVERLAGEEAAADLLRWYGEFSAERHPDSLAHHYVAYRSQVRAKVACLRAQQGDDAAAAEATDHLARCERHLQRGRVRLVVVGGAPGTGKSTLAGALADATGWMVLRADELRKELAGLAAGSDASTDYGEGIYGPESTDATYGELLARAARLAAMGESVVLDASWTAAAWRARAREQAAAVHADLVELRVDAPEALALRRIAERRARHDDPSDATAQVALALRRAAEAWPEAHRVDGAGALAEGLAAALAAVE